MKSSMMLKVERNNIMRELIFKGTEVCTKCTKVSCFKKYIEDCRRSVIFYITRRLSLDELDLVFLNYDAYHSYITVTSNKSAMFDIADIIETLLQLSEVEFYKEVGVTSTSLYTMKSDLRHGKSRKDVRYDLISHIEKYCTDEEISAIDNMDSIESILEFLGHEDEPEKKEVRRFDGRNIKLD